MGNNEKLNRFKRFDSFLYSTLSGSLAILQLQGFRRRSDVSAVLLLSSGLFGVVI